MSKQKEQKDIKYTTIRIKKDLAEKIRGLAKKEGRKIEPVTERIIEQGLKFENVKA